MTFFVLLAAHSDLGVAHVVYLAKPI